jgi:flagellar hook-associated protein 3 FlgL
MRIGSAYAQQLAMDAIAERQQKVLQAQEQLSSGRRVNRPSDDPVAAAEAERVRSQEARIQSETRALLHARERLSNADTALGEATELLQSARETLLSAGSATVAPADRAKFAEALAQVRERLLGVANRADGTGGFVFGGQGTVAAPVDPSGTVYAPVAGTQQVGREMSNPISLDGRENFTAIRTPGGTESIFGRLDATIAALRDPTLSGADAHAATSQALTSVDRALERFGVTRTTVGERLRAIDAHEQALQAGSIAAQGRLSALVDVDFAQAVSAMVNNQTGVEAAMKSYAQIARMTLFDHL